MQGTGFGPGRKVRAARNPRALQHVIFGVGERRSEILQPQSERQNPQEQGQTEIREHLANERTLLSWVRTGVSLISLGLVVERAGALAKAANLQVGSTSGSEFFGLGAGPARGPYAHPGTTPVPPEPAQHLDRRLRVLGDRLPDHSRRQPGLRRSLRHLRPVHLASARERLARIYPPKSPET